jgi:hypothetical protein
MEKMQREDGRMVMMTGENERLDVRVAVRVWGRTAEQPALQAMPADGCIRLLGAGNREETVLRFGSVFGPDASQV